MQAHHRRLVAAASMLLATSCAASAPPTGRALAPGSTASTANGATVVEVPVPGSRPAVASAAAPATTGLPAPLLPREAAPAPANTPRRDADGLVTEDVVVGTGAMVLPGQRPVVHYVGTLIDGQKFDSSRDRGQPFRFALGAGHVIQGWERGVEGMRVGGVRRLEIPAALGYGERGRPPKIPGGATLVFEIELLGIE